MRLRIYDERAILARLTVIDRRSKTAFAASCAQRLLPFYERYARSAGDPGTAARLGEIVAAVWDVASGVQRDISALQDEAERMVPSNAHVWTLETGYGQNAAAAGAYAIRTWLTDDPQEAAWAARQVYELSDYAVLQNMPELELQEPGAEDAVRGSAVVQGALAAIERSLEVVESHPEQWTDLRVEAEADGDRWAVALP